MQKPVWDEQDGVRVLRFPFLERAGAVAYFTGRRGGVSPAWGDGLNWSVAIGDDPARVRENRVRALAPAGVGLEQAVIAGLVHGADVGVVERPVPLVPSVDALVTDRQGIALVVTAADCVPVFLVDPERNAAGLVHAGWRGTVAGAGAAAVAKMAKTYGSRPESMLAVVGPSIGPCCYEVDSAVADPLRGHFGAEAERLLRPGLQPGKWMLDLWAANRADLARAGVPVQQVQIARACTACGVGEFFSHRAERGKAGRGAAVLMLRES